MRRNLNYYKREINKLPENSSMKRELKSIHSTLKNTIKESKGKNANKEYYEPRINTLFSVIRKSIK